MAPSGFQPKTDQGHSEDTLDSNDKSAEARKRSKRDGSGKSDADYKGLSGGNKKVDGDGSRRFAQEPSDSKTGRSTSADGSKTSSDGGKTSPEGSKASSEAGKASSDTGKKASPDSATGSFDGAKSAKDGGKASADSGMTGAHDGRKSGQGDQPVSGARSGMHGDGGTEGESDRPAGKSQHSDGQAGKLETTSPLIRIPQNLSTTCATDLHLGR
jgi:hypothetical protein